MLMLISNVFLKKYTIISILMKRFFYKNLVIYHIISDFWDLKWIIFFWNYLLTYSLKLQALQYFSNLRETSNWW
jgi:hypothetical protein